MVDIYKKYGDTEITLLGVKFRPKPNVKYQADYVGLYRYLEEAEEREKILKLKSFILYDLWFLCYFIVTSGNETINDDKGWFVKMATEVKNLYETYVLDVWSRGHGKSLLKTVGKTVQYHLLHPNHCTLILSYKKDAAAKFQKSIMNVYENKYLTWLFPGELYMNPQTEAPAWGLESGATLKRKNKARKESTIESCGLIEGMKTGGRFERLIYDDISTQDMVGNVDMMNACFEKFEISINLGFGLDKDIVDVGGTYFHHQDPLVKIGKMVFPDRRPLFKVRKYAVTKNGKRGGEPVLMSKAKLAILEIKGDFNVQYLLDPTPIGEQVLNGDRLQIIDHESIPVTGVAVFMLVDPAGDATKDGCEWAIGKVVVEPDLNNIALSKCYIVELVMEKFGHAEAISMITNLYMRGEYVHQIGIEDDRSMTHKFVSSDLKEKGRYVSEDMGTLVLLKHGGRNKENRIASAWQYPLLNDKWFISNKVKPDTINKLKTQLNHFPYGLKDGVDMLAYLADMIVEFNFQNVSYGKIKPLRPFYESLGSGENAWMKL